ncbi:MAG: hypothetical protein OXC53_09100 [Rhodobacteraceae bacterium]|nr:hypothetical protein [Paracoccaceae bacterium]
MGDQQGDNLNLQTDAVQEREARQRERELEKSRSPSRHMGAEIAYGQ